MSTIHVSLPSGIETEHDENEVRRLWEGGRLEDGALYWKEGMSEWRPIAELFEGSASSAPPLVSSPAHQTAYSYTKDPRFLTSFLVVMLWISLGFEVVSILGDYAQFKMLSGPLTEAEIDANDVRQGLIRLGYFGVFLVTGVAFLKWIYRANLNSRGFGAKFMRFTPGWSIGYYFVPIMSLFRPYQAMKEIWQVSQDPRGWKSQGGGPLLGSWWALWLISWAVGQWAFRLFNFANSIEMLKTATGISIVSSVIGILLCLVAVQLVKTIAGRQEELVGGAHKADALEVLS